MSEEQHAHVRTRSRYILVRLFRKINDWVNNNPESSQFWGSIISSVITLLALLVTMFFSWRALSESQKQNSNATQQLELAKQQFTSSQKQHSADSIDATNKDTILNKRFVRDTIKQNQRERAQERRNQLQDAANKQQYELNKSQLNAVQVQARIAKDQFTQQQWQYKQQVYEQRPVFTIDSSIIKSISSVKSTIQFSISNIGFRPAHIDSAVFAFYNPKTFDFGVILLHSNLDLIPKKGSIIIPNINIYNDNLKNGMTVFYLLLYYRDISNASSKIEPIFFTYEQVKPNQFTWKHYEGQVKQEFIKQLKKKKILVIE